MVTYRVKWLEGRGYWCVKRSGTNVGEYDTKRDAVNVAKDAAKAYAKRNNVTCEVVIENMRGGVIDTVTYDPNDPRRGGGGWVPAIDSMF